MNFASYFHMRGMHTLVAVIGGFAGAVVALLGAFTGLYSGWVWGLLVGAGAALFLSIVFPLVLWFGDAPYRRAIGAIEKPIVYRHPVRFAVRGGAMNGYVVLTKDTVILLSFDRGDHRMELSRDDVKTVTLSEDGSAVSLFLNATQFVYIASTATDELLEILRQEGWD